MTYLDRKSVRNRSVYHFYPLLSDPGMLWGGLVRLFLLFRRFCFAKRWVLHYICRQPIYMPQSVFTSNGSRFTRTAVP